MSRNNVLNYNPLQENKLSFFFLHVWEGSLFIGCVILLSIFSFRGSLSLCLIFFLVCLVQQQRGKKTDLLSLIQKYLSHFLKCCFICVIDQKYYFRKIKAKF